MSKRFAASSILLPSLVLGVVTGQREVNVALKHRNLAQAPQVLLTTDMAARWTAFRERYTHEPAAIKQQAKTTLVRADLQLATILDMPAIQPPAQFPFHDLGTLATTVPSIAEDFKRADLTPAQYLPILQAITGAYYTDRVNRSFHSGVLGAIDTNTVLGKNVLFLRTHEDIVQHLSFPDIQVQPMPTTWDALESHMASPLVAWHWLHDSGTVHPNFGDGHVYVLDFTAPWCIPCQQVYPILAKLEHTYGTRGLRVVYISQLFGFYGGQTLPPDAELDSLRQYVTHHELVGPMAILPSLAFSGYATAAEFELPQLVVIDGAGNIRWHHQDWEPDLLNVLAARITPLLTATR